MRFFNLHRRRHNQTSHPPGLLKPPSKKEKVQFYFQELFEGIEQMRKYLILCIVAIFATQAPNVIGMTKYNKDFNLGVPFSHVQLQVGCLIGGAVCYLASVFIRMRSQVVKRLAVQFFVLLFANIFCFIYFTFHTYDFLIAASLIPAPLTVLQAINISVSGLYLTRFLELINPFWFFRIIPPSAYFVGWLLGSYYYEGQPNAEVYINSIGGILTTCLTIWVSSSFRWKIFTKRVENETWNQIHKLILNKVPNPIAVLDVSGELIYTNPDFDKASGGKDIEAFSQKIIALKIRSNNIVEGSSRINPSSIEINDNLFDQSNDTDLDKLLIKAREFLKQGKIKENDIFVFDGKYDHDTDALAPKHQEFYEITLSFMLECEKIILILRNTTDHMRLITLESNSLYKDKLLASVSHELRTPLNGNLSLIEVSIGHEAVPQDIKDNYLIPAYHSGKLLLHLINDILDYSQIAAKKLRLNFEEFDIKSTIKGCSQLLELQARKKQIKLNLIFKGEIRNFTTDHDRLRQIILNLLSNALKFTFQGGITILVKALPRECLKIKVRDTGIGIKPEHLNSLPKEFTRLDDPQHIGMNTRGVGLGLTVADILAKMLGPSNNLFAGIKVKSRYGEGSCFSFIIQDHNYQDDPVRQNPLELDSEDEEEDSENLQERSLPSLSEVQKNSSDPIYFKSSSIKSPFQQIPTEETHRPFIADSQEFKAPKRLLIVDDEPFNILALESLLKGYDFVIETAFNGKEAIEKITENPGYDLIFMDCQMPILNGFEATKMLKVMMDKNKITQTPIIGCTAFNSKEDINLCLEVGMTHVIKKPLSKAGVEQVVKSFIPSN